MTRDDMSDIPEQEDVAKPSSEETAEFITTFKRQLLPYLLEKLDPALYKPGNKEALKARIAELVENIVDEVAPGHQLRPRLLAHIIDDIVGYGPLE